MLALVRNLVEWLPTSVHWTEVVAAPLAVAGYVVGSLVAAEVGRRRVDTWVGEAIAGVVTLLVATIAWDVALQTAPRGYFGVVGTYSNQALGAWVSIALWAGAATLLGSVAPVWTGFRRGLTGAGPALALFSAYLPLLGAVAIVGGGLLAAATGRWRAGLWLGVAIALVAAYVAWIGDLQPGAGITIGPESALWCAVVGGILLVRNAERAA